MNKSLLTSLNGLVGQGGTRSEEINEAFSQSLFAPGKLVFRGDSFSPSLSGRWIIAPGQFSVHSSVAIVSSRLKRDLENQHHWFEHLRSALTSVSRRQQTIVTSTGTTCHRFLKHAANRIGIPLIQLQMDDKFTVKEWLLGRAQDISDETLFVSPHSNLLTPDDILLELAPTIFAIQLNPNSGTFARLRAKVGSASKRVFVPTHPALVPPKIQQTLQKRGAISWHLLPHVESTDPSTAVPSSLTLPSPASPPRRRKKQIIKLSDWNPSDLFLYHCTRRRYGPWPEQSDDSFLDELLWEQPTDRSPLSVLKVILKEKKLRASSSFNRSGAKVVSLTECTLASIKSKRVFRSHLSRWDFEPYGIGFQRDFLKSAFGARPVLYGTDDQYERLADSERPYFQKAATILAGSKKIDWSDEQEWRILGDVVFPKKETNRIILFVSSMSDANELSSVTTKTIVVLNPYP